MMADEAWNEAAMVAKEAMGGEVIREDDGGRRRCCARGVVKQRSQTCHGIILSLS